MSGVRQGQIIYDAVWHLMGSNVYDLPEVLGLDIDMTVEELKIRLRIAQRVLDDCRVSGNSFWANEGDNQYPRRVDPATVKIEIL